MDPIIRNRHLRYHSSPRGEAQALLRRLEVQASFAQSFTEIQEEPLRKEWQGLLDEAKAMCDSSPAGSDLPALLKSVEALLAPIGRRAKEYTVHCVGHGHIDMNWMWSWPETVAATHDTFASVLNLMEQVPGVTYSQSQASVYALIEKHHPRMFRQIQERVREGVWEVAAVHWVEGDKNLSHGESLARHLAYTRQYFADKFNLSPEDVPVDWEPDTFGHAATLPGILAQGGVKYYYCCRPGGGHDHARIGDERPRLFWWEGPDGARVLVNRETTWYNSYVNIGDNIAEALVPFVKDTGLKDWLNVYGIGNHGGGPTLAEVRYLQETMDWPIYPRVKFGTVKGFFDAISQSLPDDLPVLAHELNFEFTGCYTSQSAIKRANRFGERFCLEAEALSALTARLVEEPVPHERLRAAWLGVLFNQFHDILPGSGVAATRNHALGLFQETAAITGAIKKETAKALGEAVDTLSLLPNTAEGKEEAAKAVSNRPYEAGAGRGAMITGYSQGVNALGRFRPFILWNPTDASREEIVTLDLYDLDADPHLLVARDEEGRSVPTVFAGRQDDWGHVKTTIAFPASVPAFGWRTYLIHEGTATEAPPTALPKERTEFETPFFDLAFDQGLSGLKLLRHRRSGVEIHGGIGQVRLTHERPVGMSAWILGQEVEESKPLESLSCTVQRVWRNGGTGAPTDAGTAYVVEQRLQIPGNGSQAILRATVHGLAPRIDFELEVDWREIGTSEKGIPGLEVSFAGFPTHSLISEAPFGTVERTLAQGEEFPTLRFVHGFEGYGLTVLQDSKHGHRQMGDRVSFRVVRSSYDPDITPEVGEQTVRFSLVFHEDQPTKADLVRLADAWDHPLLVIPAPLSAGSLPPAKSLVAIEGKGVTLTSLRELEDGSLSLRFAELEGASEKVSVRLDPLLAKGRTKAILTDLLDRPVEGEVTWDGEEAVFEALPFSVTTLRLTPSQS